MGIGDSISGMADKAKDLLGSHGDQAKEGVEKAGDAADKATGGKYAEHVDKGQQLAADQIDKLKKEQP